MATPSPAEGPKGPASLQAVIRSLSDFWADRGCAVLPPCSFEVPLGLLHPEAVFRLLDDDPWRAAFLQPISRPSDSRGGRHPFRSGRHLQFQVVWKHPLPATPRDAFIASLEALGFDLRQHDLRLRGSVLEVEAAGVRGRGWRVELDGLGLGRIHFLDQLAGQPLAGQEGRPAAVEISYGIERLAMGLAGTDDVFQVPWYSPGEGEVGIGSRSSRSKRRESEEELHRYAASVANVGYLRQVMDGLDQESERCLSAGLPRAAYELAIRLLPVLDQLETRGDLAVRERRHWLAEVSGRVAAAAELYLERCAEIASEGPSSSPAPASEEGPSRPDSKSGRASGASEEKAASDGERPEEPEKKVPEKKAPEKRAPEKKAPENGAEPTAKPEKPEKSEKKKQPRRRRKKGED